MCDAAIGVPILIHKQMPISCVQSSVCPGPLRSFRRLRNDVGRHAIQGEPAHIGRESETNHEGLAYTHPSYSFLLTAVTARCSTTKTRIIRPTTMVVHSAGTPKSEVNGSMVERTSAPMTEPST